MSKPLGFEKPLGMRDILPDLLEKQRWLEKRVKACMKQWGYQEISTPTLEYYDTVGEASATLDNRLFKLLDSEGKTVVLRPDMTAPIARVASSLLKEEPLPLRLMYSANVFRAQRNEAGRNAEFTQLGIEYIGSASVDADAEAIALAVSVLKAAGVKVFKIAVGHIGFLEGLLEEIVQRLEDRERLKEFLYHRDYVGFRHYVQGLHLSRENAARLYELLKLRGGKELIDRAESITVNGQARKAVTNLRQLWEALEAYQVEKYVLLDLNLLRNLDYYTGILFEGYAANQGFAICTGGRYDGLMARFGRPCPATGFAVQMDSLLEAVDYQPEQPSKFLILYSAEQRMEALERARKLREENSAVVIAQRKEELAALDFSQYAEVIDLTEEEASWR
ncbi:ATP phosphoribosyltransferase regulatory subunit [Aneurinibacillus thermoaerophilus]|uniref:ATP phosphoribosyltransferase regulatory subunit n=1 Tax=Aneurinibacillus thermoaerophilus TaxID=143495 RepID=A0A1G8EAD6_ANETH|nr:ATP phosphoribosyltransferase regulatory subunit [Aneurinibacillus thermoaerophilus]MED0676901.1 ATP phosphoribosyltransferase regulatory subunit [Aneurinibacillus thermoaerophilus]MED0680740.1 ATP phosphoribosyltransferase regulatory subunit [Aneurinibacillus thermoaerophilus]MED0738760.1 ATP phosphoribosyltransferase regulatory subunit [Aneurinibacillus thermoaerophilus]MED0758018.1 ATP phosphoribosyltransferase regulatory subunit [Aneurinibacillus thermoaerophilus]MED0762341.1 ATP phosph